MVAAMAVVSLQEASDPRRASENRSRLVTNEKGEKKEKNKRGEEQCGSGVERGTECVRVRVSGIKMCGA